ncbi:hypothetical protein BC835DRAFT_235711 [Cytidiella melzeri]|nr:hypothetical protein BC835DRAFT_235711 [Cytidiella melzeri]
MLQFYFSCHVSLFCTYSPILVPNVLCPANLPAAHLCLPPPWPQVVGVGRPVISQIPADQRPARANRLRLPCKLERQLRPCQRIPSRITLHLLQSLVKPKAMPLQLSPSIL